MSGCYNSLYIIHSLFTIKTMNKNAIGVVVAIVVISGGWYLLSRTPAKAPVTEAPVTNQMPIVGSTTPEMIVENTLPGVTVTYTDQGFSPKSVTVPAGTTVTFVNQSTGGLWVASAMHPSHAAYSGTSASQHCPDTTGTAFDECAAVALGSSYSFTFTKVGSWKYHNHVQATDFGAITVTAAAVTP